MPPSFEEMLKQDRKKARDRFIDEQRVKTEIDDAFEGTGLRDEVNVRNQGNTVTVEPDGYLDDDEFGQFRDTLPDFVSFERTSSGGRNFVDPGQVDEGVLPPDPMDIHESRSEYAQAQDEARSARLTNDPVLYARDPNSYDFPGVDTPEGDDASRKTTVADIRDLF